MPEETAVNETNTRTRINISLSAKGLAQWDLTCEYDTPEKSIEEMSKTIDMVRNLLKEKGIPEAGVTA
jgi:hypothetical protein